MALTRTKLAAAAVLVAGGVGTVLFPLALAQQPGAGGGAPPGATAGGGSGGGPPPAGTTGVPAGAAQPGRAPRFVGGTILPVAPPGVEGASGYPGMPGMSGGMAMAGAVSSGRVQWEYKFAGKPQSALEFAKLLGDYGEQGWEFAGLADFGRGEQLKAAKTNPAQFGYMTGDLAAVVIFKRHKGGGARAGGGYGGEGGYGGMLGAMSGMMPPMPGGLNNPFGSASGSAAGGPPMGAGPKTPGRGAARPMGMGAPGGMPSPGEGAKRDFEVIRLRSGDAKEIAKVLTEVFADRPRESFRAVAESSSNSVILIGTPADLAAAKKLIERLDQPGAEKPGTGTRPGRGGGITPGPGIPPAP